MSQIPDRRQWRLIDRNFQVGLALRLIFALFLLSVAGLAAIFAPSIYFLWTAKEPELLEKAAAEFLVLHNRIWPAAILCFAGLFAYCLHLSRRIAGPVYRIQAVLAQLLRDERPDRIMFRKGDWFQPTADLLEQLVEKLHGPSGGRGTPRGGDGR